MSNAVEKARAIQALLDEYGVTNESLESFIKEASELPSSEVLDKYNSMVEDYNNSSGYDSKMDAAEELIAFYDAHSEELHPKHHEITALKRVVEDNQRLNDLYNELESLVEDGGSPEDNEL